MRQDPVVQLVHRLAVRTVHPGIAHLGHIRHAQAKADHSSRRMIRAPLDFYLRAERRHTGLVASAVEGDGIWDLTRILAPFADKSIVIGQHGKAVVLFLHAAILAEAEKLCGRLVFDPHGFNRDGGSAVRSVVLLIFIPARGKHRRKRGHQNIIRAVPRLPGRAKALPLVEQGKRGIIVVPGAETDRPLGTVDSDGIGLGIAGLVSRLRYIDLHLSA